MITDREGVVIHVSSSVEKIATIKKEQLLGKKQFELIKNGIVKYSMVLTVIENKQPVTNFQSIYIGKEKELFINVMPTLDKYGEIERIVVTFLDLTEQNQINQEYNPYKQFIAQHYNKLKKDKIAKEKFTFKSNKMERIFQLANKVSQVDSNILLDGESGVGKEVIASYIHEMSPRNKHPFVCINCAAIPEQLLEAELFGYEGGTFTGSNKNGKIGLIESANNGTVFLDEINSMPISLQSKLLRVIETKEVSRLGSINSKKVNFRLISATNVNLEKLVEKKLFRKDLFYRLNIIPIYIPPLRERKEDIIVLITYFMQLLKNQYGINKKISSEAFEYLQSYSWPGNVRELKNVIERLFVLSSNQLITSEDLPSEVLSCRRDINKVYQKVHKSFEIKITDVTPLNLILNEVEKLLIKKALDKYGTTRPAATALKISQTSIIRKIHKNNIQNK